MPAVDLLVPGSLDSLTGGYIYDRRILAGLSALGWETRAHELDLSFPMPTPKALAAAVAVLASLPNGRITIIDGLALAGLIPALAKENSRLNIVALIHHPLAFETGIDDKLAQSLRSAEETALGLIKNVIVTSPWTRHALTAFKVPATRVAVVEPGCDRAPLSTPSDGPMRMLCVGTLTPRKGHAILFDALATQTDRPWQLRCAGSLDRDPQTATKLRRQVDRLGLKQRITFLGEISREAVAKEYGHADLFLLPSYLEGYGMAIAEAIARGLPVVSTNAGAIAQTLPAGAGILVPPGDAAALGRVLEELLGDPGKLKQLARAAATAREALPTWEDASERFARHLRSLSFA